MAYILFQLSVPKIPVENENPSWNINPKTPPMEQKLVLIILYKFKLY